MKLDEKDFSTYIHPLLINGERFLLNKNPFEYAEEGVVKYWPDQVRNKAYDLAWGEFEKGEAFPSSAEKLFEEAVGIMAKDFLKDEKFLEYYKQDGYDLIQEVKPLHLFPEIEEVAEFEEERALA